MNFGKLFLTVGLVSGLLMGCGTAKNKEEIAFDNNNPRGVNYTGDTNEEIVQRPNTSTKQMDRTRDNTRHSNSFKDAKDIANKITDLNNIDKARVIITGDTAYVAVRLDDNRSTTFNGDLEDQIIKLVKDEDSSITDVHVSEKEEFFTGLRNVNGETLTDDFFDLVDRIFPNNRIRR